MDIEFEGFCLEIPNVLFNESEDDWLVEKTENDRQFKVTLASLECGSDDPLKVWLLNATETKATFNLGESLIIEGTYDNLSPYIYYIKGPQETGQFDRHNFIHMRFSPNMVASPMGSNLQFILSSYSCIQVSHKNTTLTGKKIKVFRHDLKQFELKVNSKNSVQSIGANRCGIWDWCFWLEEKEEASTSSGELYFGEGQICDYIRKKSDFDFHLISFDCNIVETHKVVLEARTNILERESWSENAVKLPMSKEALEDFVHFLIHDEVKNMESNALELFELASKYNVVLLKQQCEEYFDRIKVSSENESEVERLACEYESEELLKALVRYRKERKEYVFDTPTTLAQDLATAGDQESEVVLISQDGKEVKCPSLLLICRSKIFKKRLKLESQMKAGERATIKVFDYGANVLKEFVHFLKTDKVQDMKTHAAQLLLLAFDYSVPKLGVDCINYICDNIDHFSTFQLLRASKKIASPKLDRALEDKLANLDSSPSSRSSSRPGRVIASFTVPFQINLPQ